MQDLLNEENLSNVAKNLTEDIKLSKQAIANAEADVLRKEGRLQVVNELLELAKAQNNEQHKVTRLEKKEEEFTGSGAGDFTD